MAELREQLLQGIYHNWCADCGHIPAEESEDVAEAEQATVAAVLNAVADALEAEYNHGLEPCYVWANLGDVLDWLRAAGGRAIDGLE